MSELRAVTKVTRGHQMTIPKSIRERLGLRVGDIVEVTTDAAGQMVARKVELEERASLDWGTEFARKHRITEADILIVTRSTRREVFKEEYG